MSSTSAETITDIAAEVDRNLRALARTDFDPVYWGKYFGRSRPALGLKNDQTRAIAKAIRQEHPKLAPEAWFAVLDALYTDETYEHRLVAGMILGDNKAVRQAVPLARLGEWIRGLEGWAEVDGACQSTWSGEEMLARWVEWQTFLAAAARDESISLQRASLVLLCKPVRTSKDLRLRDQAFANIDILQHRREILITKAVSWLLREMVPLHADAVAAYLDANRSTLPAIAVRETRNKLNTGVKSKRNAEHP